MRAWKRQRQSVGLETSAPAPSIDGGEVLIAPGMVSLSPADVRGEIGFEGTIGREFVGRVVELGGGVPEAAGSKLRDGRVVGWPVVSCGSCDMCMAGLGVHCRQGRELGRAGLDGCLAERCVLPFENLCLVPVDIEDEAAVLAVRAAHALHAAQLAAPSPDDHVTVLGDGLDALLTAQILCRASKGTRLLGSHAATFARCEKWGIPHRHIDEPGRRQDQDVVFDCAGTSSSLALATQLVRPRGLIVLCGQAHGSGGAESFDAATVARHELRVIGATGGSIADGVAAIASGRILTDGLVSHRFGFGDVPQAISSLGEPDSLGVIVELGSGGRG